MAKLLSRFGSKRDLNDRQDYQCIVRLLDDEEVLQTTFQADQKGQYLLDYVFKALNLMEKDYFGLRYVDSNEMRYWLDPTRPILKQVKGVNPIVFCFRVKFYPANPGQLKDELTRYFVYLQLRRDLLNRRLYCMPSEAAYLLACVAQSELGDYDAETHKDNYLSDIKLLPDQNEKLELEAMEIHQREMKDHTPADAELLFIERAVKLETYGIEPHPVKDDKRNQLFIGINFSGIIAFQGNRRVHHYKWNEIQKITYEGKMFIVHYLSNGKKNLIGFKAFNVATCQNLWRSAVEQRYFFTMASSSEIPSVITGGGYFSKQCKLRYSGRVEREIIEDMRSVSNNTSTINRRHSLNNGRSSSTLGRSNTAPLNESPDLNRYFGLNSTTASEPGHRAMPSQIEGSGSMPALASNCTINSSRSRRLQPGLDKFDEEDDWEAGNGPNLPTEFDLRPDLTPTNDGGESSAHLSHFERPVVRSSPSQYAKTSHAAYSESEESDSDEDTLEQVSEIVDQTPSTCQLNPSNTARGKNARKPPPKPKISCGEKMLAMVATSILSALIMLCITLSLLVIVLELDSSWFDQLRQLPELVVFDRDYYRPLKETILHSFAKN